MSPTKRVLVFLANHFFFNARCLSLYVFSVDFLLDKGSIPASANAHSQVLTKFLAYLLITIGRIREHQKVGKIKNKFYYC
jgi:hypothetical protein